MVALSGSAPQICRGETPAGDAAYWPKLLLPGIALSQVLPSIAHKHNHCQSSILASVG